MKFLKIVLIMFILLTALFGILWALELIPDDQVLSAFGKIAAVFGIIALAGVVIRLLNGSKENSK